MERGRSARPCLSNNSDGGAFSTLGEYEVDFGYRITERASIGLGLYGMALNKTVAASKAWGSPSDAESIGYLGLSLAMDYDF